MTASHAERVFFKKSNFTLGAATALALAVVPAMSLAQSGPIDLSPPTPPMVAEPASPQGIQSQTEVITPPVMVEPASAIHIEGLSDVNVDIIGVLAESQGGFSRDLWFGMGRGEIESLMAKLPVTTSSPTVRDLLRRILLSAADVPEGEPGTLIALRARALTDMGDFVGVTTLMNAVPARGTHKELLRIEVDTRFLTGDIARACELAQLYMAEESSTYWQKAFIFCQALSGQHDAAGLGVSLLREMGAEDKVFYSLIDYLGAGGRAPRIDSLPDPQPLHLALARTAKMRLPGDVLESNRPGVLRAIAISPNATPELRLEAAERAEVAGAFPVDALRQLYASIQFPADALRNPLKSSAKRSGPMSRALLYRASLMQTAADAQAKGLAQALSKAREGGRYASTARAFLPILSRVPPVPELAWFAPEAIRAFLMSGRHDDAKPWFAMLEAAATRDDSLARQLEVLMPVAKLSGFEAADDWPMTKLEDWWKALEQTLDQAQIQTDTARDNAALLAAVFDALGEPVPDTLWVALLEGPERRTALAPHPALWFRLDAAAGRAHVGETVLLAMVILGDGGPARAEPMVLHRVLQSLRTVGLGPEARAMALEAIINAGL